MHWTRARALGIVAATSVLVAATAIPAFAQTDAATATSAEDFGGMEGLIAAAQEEGTLNVIALPPDWANYGQMIDDFEAKYGINVESAQPDASSQEEIDAVNNLAGTDAAPDVLDMGPTIALANTDLYAPYKVAAWDDIPDDLKDPDGLWVSDYTGFMSIGCDVGRVALPETVADLLKPEYAGMVALNGNPTQSGAGFNGVVMAALANGGSADDIAPGVDFFKQLNEAGNLLPVDPSPATIASGQTPCVIDWEYTNAAQTSALEGMIDWQVTIPSDAPPVASYYIQAINKEAPQPGCRASVAGVPVLAGGPEHLAQGFRTAGPAGQAHRRRDRRRGSACQPRAGLGHSRPADPGADRCRPGVPGRELGHRHRVAGAPQR